MGYRRENDRTDVPHHFFMLMTLLRKTNNKFTERINYIEKKLQKKNKKFNQSNLIELEELWNQAKKDIKQVK